MNGTDDQEEPAAVAVSPLQAVVRGKGRIKVGAGIFQDHHFGKWPNCCPPNSEYEGEEYQYRAKNPDMVFDVEWTGRHWDCRADGYGSRRWAGELGEYGSGSISVDDHDGVELLDPTVDVTCAMSKHEDVPTVEASSSPTCCARTDAERLEWMISNEAWVGWNREGEYCRVWRKGDDEPVCGWPAFFESGREAIDAAIAHNAALTGAHDETKENRDA